MSCSERDVPFSPREYYRGPLFLLREALFDLKAPDLMELMKDSSWMAQDF